MTLTELINQFRNFTDDNVQPYLWSDEEIILYINEAEKEVARRTRCLTDSQDPILCNLQVTSGESVYKLDSRILYIKKIKTSAHTSIIQPIKSHILETFDSDWENRVGRVDYAVTDHNSKSITLYRVPSEDQTLKLTIIRLPLNKLVNYDDTPEIPEEYHLNMLNYVYYLAYMKQDVEGNSEKRSMMFYQIFESEFGPKYLASALQEEFENENAYIFNDGRR